MSPPLPKKNHSSYLLWGQIIQFCHPNPMQNKMRTTKCLFSKFPRALLRWAFVFIWGIFSIPLALPQRHCWKSLKKIKKLLFQAERWSRLWCGQPFPWGCKPTTTVKSWGILVMVRHVWSVWSSSSTPCPEWLWDQPWRQQFRHCAQESSSKPLTQCQLTTSHLNFLTSRIVLSICLSVSPSPCSYLLSVPFLCTVILTGSQMQKKGCV